MEDEHVMISPYAGSENLAYFAVYDGHGGRKVVESVKRNLHQKLEEKIMGTDPLSANIEEIFRTVFPAVDEQVRRDVTIGIPGVKSLSKTDASGCTAAVAILKLNKPERWLHMANVGDSRVVLNRGGKALRVSYDHKASDVEEKKRIEAVGGMILHGKVAGIIGVTRAFGDFELKSKDAHFLVSEPYLQSIQLEKDDHHLILACDGLFDVASDQEVIDFVAKCSSAQEAAEGLVKYALDHHTKDNISVIVIFL